MIKFHFLNVGHGDCTIVELPTGRLTMIDINNSKVLDEDEEVELALRKNIDLTEFKRQGSYSIITGKSWEDYYKDMLVDPYDYYTTNFNGKSIFRYIQTHPDMDHMSGLHNFYWDKKVTLWNFWDINHTKIKSKEDFPEGSKNAYIDWLVYQQLRQGIGPNGFNSEDYNNSKKDIGVMKNQRFSTGSFWSEDNIHVLSPSFELIEDSNGEKKWNNASYVLRFDHGGRRVILSGDAERKAWQSIIDNIKSDDLSCDILKAAHHGRKSGFHEESVDAMNPAVVVCSIGKKPESSDAHQDYKNKGADVFSTRSNGTITATIWDDGEVWVDNSKGERLSSLPALV